MDGTGLRVAKAERFAVELAAEIPVGIDEDGIVIVLSGQLSDEGLLGLFAIARKGLDAPEAPARLVRNLVDEILLVQPRLVESSHARRPMAAAAGNNRVGLANPFARHVGDRLIR